MSDVSNIIFSVELSYLITQDEMRVRDFRNIIGLEQQARWSYPTLERCYENVR